MPRARPKRRHSSLQRRLRRFYWFRVLIKDPLFLGVAGLLVIATTLAILAIPKRWQTTPDDFPGGVVRVSWIDLLQARSLARSARQAEAEGRWDDALLAWRGAETKNSGDLRWHRALVACLLKTPEPQPDEVLLARSSIDWLLKLTATNRADLITAAEVLERYGQPAQALSLIDSSPHRDDPALTPARARCLLGTGRFEEFQPLWEGQATEWQAETPLRWYGAAWRAATGNPSERASATEALRKATKTPGEEGLIAARLLHQIAVLHCHSDDIARSLQRLAEARAASAAQHAAAWACLAANGRLEEARRLAADYPSLPLEPTLAAALIRALRLLGLDDLAVQRFSPNLTRYGNQAPVWREYFELLAAAERWDDLRRASDSSQVQTSRREPLYAEALFARYRALHGQGRTADADRTAEALATAEAVEPGAVLRLASRLREDERPGPAHDLLRRFEEVLGARTEYWSEVFAVAQDDGDLNTLRHAVEALARLNPQGGQWQAARAALLLITGEEPSEALRLTFDALSRHPQSTALRINHAFALIRNQRLPEARRLLETISVDRLSPRARANFFLALAELNAGEGRWEETLAASARIDRRWLLAPQLERLERLTRQAREHPRTPGR